MKYLLIFVLIFTACSTKKWRSPSSYFKKEAKLGDLLSDLQLLTKTGFPDGLSCYESLSRYYNEFLSLNSFDVNLDQYSQNEIASIVNSSFKTRLSVLNRLNEIDPNSKHSVMCLNRIRDMIRVLRSMEDYFLEVYSKRENLLELKSFSSKLPYLSSNAKFSEHFKIEDLKSGDIILSRGNAYSSAAIARIGLVDTQFSHLTLVYRNDDEIKTIYTMEAHIEIGNVTAPIDVHLKQENAREVVFRYKDPVLAAKAAKVMYLKIKNRQDKGKNIPYDFGMNYHDNKTLFCSEVIYDGFFTASHGKVNIPKFKTKFDGNLIPFLKTLGIKVNKKNINKFDTFGPGDIEYDPDFKLVAEWRNPLKSHDIRLKNLILTKIFEYMEQQNYNFHARGNVKRKALLGWIIRRLPYLKNKVKDDFPLNMGINLLELFMTLDQVGDIFYNRIVQEEKNAGRYFSPSEIFSIIDDFRKEDYILYQNGKDKVVHPGLFHDKFYPDIIKNH